MNWTEEEYQDYVNKQSFNKRTAQVKKRANKYNVADKANRTLDGIVFDSKAEMQRYSDLKMLERTGQILDLELQPEFVLQEGFAHKGKKHREIKYVADFKYYDVNKKCEIVEDVKGKKTSVYQVKKKMLLKRYPDINFVEVN